MRFVNDISGKALLYAIPLFLTPFIDKLGTLLLNGQWPTIPAVVGCTLLGICGAAIGLRAFFDGSYERRKNGSDEAGTQFFTRPVSAASQPSTVLTNQPAPQTIPTQQTTNQDKNPL